MERGYIPQGLLDSIARIKNDYTGEIRQHSTEERFLPPSIKISPTTKRWLQSIDHVETIMYVVRGPSNILPVYQGISGANESIVPSGGLAALGGPVTYFIMDRDDNIYPCPTVLQYGGVDETVQYRMFTIDNYGNYSYVQRFVLRSVTSNVVNNDMVVANITWMLPNHVANGSIGTIAPSWVATSNHTNVLLQIMSVDNVGIRPSVGITNGQQLAYTVGAKGSTIGDVIAVSYRLYTPEGNVSPIETVTVPMIFNTPPLLDGFITNMPTTILVGQTFPFIWGGGLDIDGDDVALDVLQLSGATMYQMYDINPGITTPLTVTGNVGDTLVMIIRLKDRFGVSASRRITSNIIVNPPDISQMYVTLDGAPIESQSTLLPCDSVTLVYDNIIDISGNDITISLSSPVPGVTFSTSVFSPGTTTVLSVPCGIDPNDLLEINAIISNGVSSITRTDLVTITPRVGHELINYSRIFIKPAGVTSLTVIGRGGIGVPTMLTGLITHTFLGAAVTETEYPQPSTVLFNNLTGDAAAITVDLATNTVLNFHWS